MLGNIEELLNEDDPDLCEDEEEDQDVIHTNEVHQLIVDEEDAEDVNKPEKYEKVRKITQKYRGGRKEEDVEEKK